MAGGGSCVVSTFLSFMLVTGLEDRGRRGEERFRRKTKNGDIDLQGFCDVNSLISREVVDDSVPHRGEQRTSADSGRKERKEAKVWRFFVFIYYDLFHLNSLRSVSEMVSDFFFSPYLITLFIKIQTNMWHFLLHRLRAVFK